MICATSHELHFDLSRQSVLGKFEYFIFHICEYFIGYIYSGWESAPTYTRAQVQHVSLYILMMTGTKMGQLEVQHCMAQQYHCTVAARSKYGQPVRKKRGKKSYIFGPLWGCLCLGIARLPIRMFFLFPLVVEYIITTIFIKMRYRKT